MTNNIKTLLAIAVLTAFTSCQTPGIKQKDTYQHLNDSIRNTFAPDKRVAIYDISLTSEGESLVIRGETDQPDALRTLTDLLEKEGEKVRNLAVMLPDSSVGKFTHALANNSVANIRSAPKHSGELATQAILGTALRVLKIQGDFYLVQNPDGYISWVDHGGVTLLTAKQFDSWEKSAKIIFTKGFGYVYEAPGDELSKIGDLVLGAQLMLTGEAGTYYKVAYPDKREGYVKKSESSPYLNWINELAPSGTLIELYAKELMGAPYLWGGTSSKGMDCSGFTKTVYLMNGFVIPRDASQQILAGEDIDPNLKLEELQKGDLMFFGKRATDSTKQRVTHVAIWLGNGQGEFIHASGRVKLGSVNPESPYFDAFNTDRYLGSRRYLGSPHPMIRDLKKDLDTMIKS